jgi:3'(2'), 5'-bisphosphate nucleotidase
MDDHEFSVFAAEAAGARLLEVRQLGLEGRALKDAGDAAAQALLAELLAEHRPDDHVLSEEASDDKSRLDADRVWIIDPLDGTREFSEPPRDDWAVHVALWERSAGESGDLTAGAVAQPALGETFDTGTPVEVPPRTGGRPRIAVSRTRPPAFVQALAEERLFPHPLLGPVARAASAAYPVVGADAARGNKGALHGRVDHL